MNNRGFTLIELLTVMTIIGILAGLILMTSGFVQKKAASSRAEAEIQAMSAACESYKADNGIYPRDTPSTGVTDVLNARTNGTPSGSAYLAASLFLYKELSGARTSPFRQTDSGAKQYMEFKPNMLAPSDVTKPVTNIQDPFGFSYGYSTAYTKWQEAGSTGTQLGYNPTFDLWSTAGKTTAPGGSPDVTLQWIKNW